MYSCFFTLLLQTLNAYILKTISSKSKIIHIKIVSLKVPCYKYWLSLKGNKNLKKYTNNSVHYVKINKEKKNSKMTKKISVIGKIGYHIHYFYT